MKTRILLTPRGRKLLGANPNRTAFKIHNEGKAPIYVDNQWRPRETFRTLLRGREARRVEGESAQEPVYATAGWNTWIEITEEP